MFNHHKKKLTVSHYTSKPVCETSFETLLRHKKIKDMKDMKYTIK